MKISVRWFALAGLGAAVSLLLGSSLVALLSDSVSFQGNEAESGLVGSHDVQAAVVSSASDCAGATFSDGPVSAAIDVDVNLDSNASLPVSVMCLKNNGTGDGELIVQFANVADLEVAPCPVSESVIDLNCDPGQQGELSEILDFGLSSTCSGSGGTAPAPFNMWVTTVQGVGNLDVGEICAVTISPMVREGLSQNLLLEAQTDRLTWDIIFTLQD